MNIKARGREVQTPRCLLAARRAPSQSKFISVKVRLHSLLAAVSESALDMDSQLNRSAVAFSLAPIRPLQVSHAELLADAFTEIFEGIIR